MEVGADNSECVNSVGLKQEAEVRKLLVFDTAYSFEAIRERKLEDSVTCRDLGGFFEHVWSVHPFASIVTSEKWASKFGKPESYNLDSCHTFIEGKVGRYRILRGIAPLNFLISQLEILVALRRLVRKEKISVIRSGDPLYLGLFGLALSRLCGIPLVLRIGANYDKSYETTGRPRQARLFYARWVEKIVERFVFKNADLVAGANQDNLNFALENGARPETSTLFRYGNLIDKRHFVDPEARPEGQSLLSELGLKAPFLLYIGRLEEIKHPDDVIKVLAETRKRGHDVQAVLVGDGSLREKLKTLARELEMGDHVIFCGNKDQEWLSRVIPLALVIISPHTGRALSEAALGGVPIVAYDVDWQGELIQSGLTGELVPYAALEKMIDAVERIINSPEYACKVGAAVRKRAIEMLDPEMLDQHERDTYLKLFNI